MEWTSMVWLGAYHGINPGMGWLFAVALGMQAGHARGVWRALPPLAAGHAAAVGLTLAAAWLLQFVLPLGALQVVVAGALVSQGLYRLWRHRHPRFGGMRVGARDLTMWSFLMASAHGAGFMVLPFVLGEGSATHVMATGHAHAAHDASASLSVASALALVVHTVAYLGTAGIVAHVVYRKLGLGVLRTAWFNLDWIWAVALVVTGLAVLVR